MTQTTSVSIRAAEVSEAHGLAELIRAAFEEYRGVFDPPSGAHDETGEKVAKKMEQGGAYIAELNSKIVGCVIYEMRPDYVYLGRLAVLPEARGQGIASRLIQQVEDAAIKAEKWHVQLGVRLILVDNRRLFESLGYQLLEYESHEGYTKPTSIKMQKILRS